MFPLRYNNYKEDPLSWCDACNPHANGENAISARSDLNPADGTYPFGALTQRPHGGTDMKVWPFLLGDVWFIGLFIVARIKQAMLQSYKQTSGVLKEPLASENITFRAF